MRSCLRPIRSSVRGLIGAGALAACCLALGRAAGAAPAAADWGQPSYARYVLDAFGADQGFTQANARAALQTRDGYVWIGTENGLVRFDGVRFVSFRVSNTPGLPSNYIDCLCEDRAGVLWIGTERGLVRYRNGAFAAYGFRGYPIRALTEGPGGSLWIGVYGRGLFRIRGGPAEDMNPPGGFGDAEIHCLLADTAGGLWIGVVDLPGVVRRLGGRFELYKAGGLLDDQVDSLCEWPRGTVWIGTHVKGLYRWRKGACVPVATPAASKGLPVTGFAPAADGGLWVAHDDVEYVAGPGADAAEAAPGLPAHDVLRLSGDSEGGLWICAREQGLFRAPPNPYMVLSSRQGLPGNRVKTVSADARGDLWLGIDGTGVCEVAADGRVVHPPGLWTAASPPPRSLVAAGDGSILTGLTHLQRYRDGRLEEVPGVVNVYGIFEDRAGALWVGTGHGLYRNAGAGFEPVAPPLGRPFRLATSFADGPDGSVYAGSWSLGILRWRAGRATLLDHRSGMPADDVRALHVDRDGSLWVGFASRGLAVRAAGRWFNPTGLSELLADHVSAILEDNFGRLWFGTPAGIFYADRTRLLAAARGLAPPPILRRAGWGEPSHRPAVWSGTQPTAWKMSDGRLLFATREGVVVINPAEFRDAPPPPSIHIEGAEIDGRPVPVGGRLAVPAGARRIQFSFSAPSFNDPQDIRFRYRLEGYDPDWIYGGLSREARYTGVSPGAYVFRVMAASADGRWDDGDALRLAIAPTFWERRAVRFAALVLVVVGLVGLVRYVSFRRLRARLRELEQRAAVERERARIARDIHDDVGNRMTEIILLSRLALGERLTPADREDHLRRIGSSAREVTDALDEIVWAISPRSDTLRHLMAYLGEFAVEFLRAAGIACELELPDAIPDQPVSAEVRHNVFLSVKEALSNVVRHAGADRVWLRVTLARDRIAITVRDNGQGMARDSDRERPGADGLRNIAQRMRDIQGGFAIASRPGAGTEVALEFRLSP